MSAVTGSGKNSTYLSSLLSIGMYKKNHGRLVRQITAAVLIAISLLAGWAFWSKVAIDWGTPLEALFGHEEEGATGWEYFAAHGIAAAAPVLLAGLGAWVAFRLVNYPKFADFLIDVEGEMLKVSWPGSGELYRATIVVLISMFFVSFLLFAYDIGWRWLLQLIHVLEF